tara:strand:- start:3649 stop:4482 length:834 start_codon:yes stop_codon:yes gene_type:complete
MFRKAPPSNRNFADVMNHYHVEKALATKLKQASREQRKVIYATMYDELFAKVPDHPRLTQRDTPKLRASRLRNKMAFLRRFLSRDKTLVEFAPGDCKLLHAAAERSQFAIGVDISDQRASGDAGPGNAELVVYDGYDLSRIASESIDVAFSDQLIEHFHIDDTRLHFETALRILKPSGEYAFRTPHRFTGPHDVSQYFSDVPEGFHLKEWTYAETKSLLNAVGFSSYKCYWSAKFIHLRLPGIYFSIAEVLIKPLPNKFRGLVAKLLMPSVTISAKK